MLKWATVDSFRGNTTSPMLAEHRPCPVCGALDHRTVLTLEDFQFFSDSFEEPKRLSIREVQCRGCYALYLNPGYSGYGFRVLFAEAGCSYGSTTARPGEQIEWLAARGLLQAGTRLLDVGCYDGRFLAQLPQDVAKVGFDIDLPAIERGRSLYGDAGIDFVHGDFESFRPDSIPDTITMFHVLEHLPRPLAALVNLRQLAHNETRLVLEVPILENGITNDINGFFSAQHMTHFSRRSVTNLLKRSGWHILEQQEQPNYNGFRTLARPGKIEDDALGDPEDHGRLLAYLSAWYKSLHKANEKLAQIAEDDRVLIWGGGMHLEFLYQVTSFFSSQPSRKLAVVDSDPLKQGKTWRGIPIHSPTKLMEIDRRHSKLLVSSYGGQEAIKRAAVELGFPVEHISHLYDDVRVY